MNKVVKCINAKPPKGFFMFGIKEGLCYTVDNTYICPNCKREYYLLSDVFVPKNIPKVCLCGINQPYNAYSISRFRIMEYGFISNTSLIQEIIEERIDIPVTETSNL